MKKIVFIFSLLLISCSGGGGDGDSGGGGGDPPPPSPPGDVTLTAPTNGKVCETGTSSSDTKSNVDFSWSASTNTSTYDLQVTNLNTSSAINKTGLSTTNTTVELDKGQPYIWKVISKNTSTTQTGTSSSWKFYLAGHGITNYAPFAAELKSPVSGSTVSRSSDGKVTFSWEGSDPDQGDQLKYTLYVDKTDGKQSPTSDLSDITSKTVDVALDEGTLYYWRVKTSDGTNSSFSIVYTFRTE
tara:strand:- start:1175 stop:1900 length:726 start_codon:yes stop_codon:yes gene_type:complete